MNMGIDNKTNDQAMKNEWRIMVLVCALVIGVYACMAQWGISESLNPNPAESRYNLLVEGFQAGHLSLNQEVPSGLAHLTDPYDPVAIAPFRLGPDRLYDLSYYKGKLYLYYGVTPALILFWPFAAVTGEYLFHKQAVAIFCAIGFLASVGLLRGLWRRYFFETSVWVVAACALALGLTTGVPMLLPRSSYNEVATSCGYMLTMLGLGAIWCALHESKRQCWWLAAASVAFGLALGARPNLSPVILLVPVAQAWQERRKIWALLLAAAGPIMVIALGLMLYNYLRFDSPFEFGFRYALTFTRQPTRQLISLHHLWFNFRVYFLEMARWSRRFPFVHEIALPPLPAGYMLVETPFGVLTNVPLVWMALAVPLAWWNRSEQTGSILRWFATTTALLFGVCALALCLFVGACGRYEVDFLPALVFLAVIGILSLERALTDRPGRRRATRWGWGVLLAFSVAFNLFASVAYCAFVYNDLGNVLLLNGRVREAMKLHEQALWLDSDYADAHNSLGSELFALGNVQEGSQHFERSLQLRPDSASTHYDWGNALARSDQLQDAISQYQEALRLKPNYPDAHNNLGLALMTVGRTQEAIQHYQQALQINPNYPQAHNSLGNALFQQGKTEEAISHYEQALQTWPDSTDLHYNLGFALEKMGRTPEAIAQYERVLDLKPNSTAARDALRRLQAGQ
jgi:tetratricopeptide (TPR) repeat protein